MLGNQTNLASIATDFKGLSKLKLAAKNNDSGADREVAQQFESLFLKMMIKSMRASENTGILDSAQTDMARDLYDEQLALQLSKRGGIGIADLIMRQSSGQSDLHQQASVAGNVGAIRRMDSPPFSAPLIKNTAKVVPIINTQIPAPRQQPVVSANPTLPSNFPLKPRAHWDSPKDFITELKPAADLAAAKLGTEPEAILAIAALETGWGKHVISVSPDQSSYNLFGIKADKNWQNNRVFSNTLEFEGGVMKTRKEPFRTYHSAAESVLDFANFITNNPRYQTAIEHAADPKRFIDEIHKAGYATDPAYKEKVKSVMVRVSSMTKDHALIADNR